MKKVFFSAVFAVTFAMFCACSDDSDDPADKLGVAGEGYAKCGEETYDPATAFCDFRDSTVYRMVTIGEGTSAQIWMAENLNYAPPKEYISSMGFPAWSGCYGEDGPEIISGKKFSNNEIAENCATYGRLYTWQVAMDNANCASLKECKPSGKIQGICPDGWHLPSSSEWQELFSYVGKNVGSDYVGTALKSATGWKNQEWGGGNWNM